MKNYHLFPFTLLVLVGCRRELPTTPIPEPDTLEILWSTPITDNGGCITQPPLVAGSSVIFSAGNNQFQGESESLISLDTSDGLINNTWHDFYSSRFTPTIYNSLHQDSIQAIARTNSVAVINCANMTTLWKGPVATGGVSLGYNRGELYKGVSVTTNGVRSAQLIKTPLHNESWSTIFAYQDTLNWNHSFSGFHFSTLSDGREILFLRNRRHNPNGTELRLDLLAYDLTSDTLLWSVSNLEADKSGGTGAIVSDESNIYLAIDQTVVALSKSNGVLEWKFDLTGHSNLPCSVLLSNLTIDNGQLLFSSNCLIVFSLSTVDGTINWTHILDDAQVGINYLNYHAGIICLTTIHGIVFIDGLSGEKIGETVASDLGSISPNILIDWDQRKLYFAAYNKAYCARLPDHIR